MLKLQGLKAVQWLVRQPGISKLSIRILVRKLRRLKNLYRDKPPVKGGFVKMLADKGKDYTLYWTQKTKRKVLSEIARLSEEHPFYSYLLEMENFQWNQKGPISPIGTRTFIDSTISKVLKESERSPDESAKRDLLKAMIDVEKNISQYMSMSSYDLTAINFGEEWAKLPNSSVRGMPYFEKGSVVDAKIIQDFGTHLTTVLPKFLSISHLITTPGTRFQGSPVWDIAKVRLINIPDPNFQYMTNGLYQNVKKELIKTPQMVGWLAPEERLKAMMAMWALGKKLGYTPIPLDFRSFDARMFPEFRLAATLTLLKVFKPCKQLELIKAQYKRLYFNQVLCHPGSECTLNISSVNNLLGSGVANTQADGSIMNYALQLFLCKKLGFEQPKELGLTLGDDAVIWVPNVIFNKLGYEGILKFWQKCLDPLNMEIHVKKKFPLPEIFFLQNLYMPDKGIINEYSLVRNIDSLVWAEHYRRPIEGVRNHMALETIGQISTLNNSMQGRGDTTLKRVVHIVVEEWLKVDRALCMLCQIAAKTKRPEQYLFGFLVSCVGGINTVIRAFKLDQYDHKGLTQRFMSESSESFPIIAVMIRVAKELPEVKVSLTEIYGQSDSQVTGR